MLALPLVVSAQTTPVIQLQNLAHAVESLDKTVPFYRDVIGLPVNGRDPLAAQPQALKGHVEVHGDQRRKLSCGNISHSERSIRF